MPLTARISPISNAIILELVSSTGKTKTEIIEKALKTYRYQERMRLLNESYAELKLNKKNWENELKERDDLDGTAADGLD
jgi:DNA repair exonuclease SbcCD ATPase subunit